MAAVELEQQQGGGLQTAKDLFSGAVGGIAQVLIGMRFHFFFSGLPFRFEGAGLGFGAILATARTKRFPTACIAID